MSIPQIALILPSILGQLGPGSCSLDAFIAKTWPRR
jgi:hypothetical protein